MSARWRRVGGRYWTTNERVSVFVEANRAWEVFLLSENFDHGAGVSIKIRDTCQCGLPVHGPWPKRFTRGFLSDQNSSTRAIGILTWNVCVMLVV